MVQVVLSTLCQTFNTSPRAGLYPLTYAPRNVWRNACPRVFEKRPELTPPHPAPPPLTPNQPPPAPQTPLPRQARVR